MHVGVRSMREIFGSEVMPVSAAYLKALPVIVAVGLPAAVNPRWWWSIWPPGQYAARIVRLRLVRAAYSRAKPVDRKLVMITGVGGGNVSISAFARRNGYQSGIWRLGDKVAPGKGRSGIISAQ